MRINFLILTILICLSCTKKKAEVLNFDLIDVSIYDGWSNYYCLKVNKDGQTYIFNNRHRKGETYYKIILQAKELDSLSILAKTVLSSKLDTLYNCACQDCGAYNLIIESKGTVFRSLVDGIDHNNDNIRNMNKLISYLYSIAEISRDRIDSVFVFKSRTFQFYPPPIPPGINQNKFTIPLVEDTIE